MSPGIQIQLKLPSIMIMTGSVESFSLEQCNILSDKFKETIINKQNAAFYSPSNPSYEGSGFQTDRKTFFLS